MTKRSQVDGRCRNPEPWRSELRLFVSRLGVGSEVDDIVQEAFLRFLETPPDQRPRAWLYRVALNVARDRIRRRESARLAQRDVAVESQSTDPADVVGRRLLARRVQDFVQRLPEKPRLALMLRIHRHMDYDEVALVLGCSVGTARQHFYLGLKAIRDRLAEES